MKKIQIVIVFGLLFFSCNGVKKEECPNKSINDVYVEFSNVFFAITDTSRALNRLNSITFYICNDYKKLVSYKHVNTSLISDDFPNEYKTDTLQNGDVRFYFYFFNSYNDTIYDARVVQIGKVDSTCYKIVNVDKFENVDKFITEKNKLLIQRKEQEAIKRAKLEFGNITTIADGYDVKKVKLWSSTDPNRKQVGYCVNNERVEIGHRYNGYVYVSKKNGISGYCLEGFLK